MTALDLDAIEARAAAATVGPWETRTGGDMTVSSASIHSGARSIMVERDGYHFGYADIADAEFIAHARTDVPALVAALRERDNTITRVREVLDADGFEYTNFIPRLRAALDRQETP